MFKDILKVLQEFFDFKTAIMFAIGLLAFVFALYHGDAVTSMWIFSATAWVVIARVNERSREDIEARCSDLFDLLCGKEKTFKDAVSEINRSYEAKLKEKEAETVRLREQLEQVTQKYKEAEAKNEQLADNVQRQTLSIHSLTQTNQELQEQLSNTRPVTKLTVKGRKKTEYSDKDVTRIKTELRSAGLTKDEE